MGFPMVQKITHPNPSEADLVNIPLKISNHPNRNELRIPKTKFAQSLNLYWEVLCFMQCTYLVCPYVAAVVIIIKCDNTAFIPQSTPSYTYQTPFPRALY